MKPRRLLVISFAMSVQSIRQTSLLESDWKFHLGDIPASVPNKHISAYMANKAGWAGGAAKPDFDDSDWSVVSVPHDWSVEGSFDPANHVDNGFLPRGIGWYRRHFRLDESDRGKYLALQFDGVARHCMVAVNGHVLHRNFCGYTPFTVEISDIANYGEELNVVAVRVDATPMEGWWYEGAGIYRHVWLIKTSPIHIDDVRGIRLSAKGFGRSVGYEHRDHIDQRIRCGNGMPSAVDN